MCAPEWVLHDVLYKLHLSFCQKPWTFVIAEHTLNILRMPLAEFALSNGNSSETRDAVWKLLTQFSLEDIISLPQLLRLEIKGQLCQPVIALMLKSLRRMMPRLESQALLAECLSSVQEVDIILYVLLEYGLKPNCLCCWITEAQDQIKANVSMCRLLQGIRMLLDPNVSVLLS